MIIYRKRVMHATRKNYQLDLFDPDNGTWEYSAVATNLPFDTRTLWRPEQIAAFDLPGFGRAI